MIFLYHGKVHFIIHFRCSSSQFYNFTSAKANIAKCFPRLILKGNLAQTHRVVDIMFRAIFILAIVRPTHFLIFLGLWFKTHDNGVLCTLCIFPLTFRSVIKFNVITLIMPQTCTRQTSIAIF